LANVIPVNVHVIRVPICTNQRHVKQQPS